MQPKPAEVSSPRVSCHIKPKPGEAMVAIRQYGWDMYGKPTSEILHVPESIAESILKTTKSEIVTEPQAGHLAAISVQKATQVSSARKAPQKPSQATSRPQAKRDRTEYQREFMRKKRAKEKAEKNANAAKG